VNGVAGSQGNVGGGERIASAWWLRVTAIPVEALVAQHSAGGFVVIERDGLVVCSLELGWRSFVKGELAANRQARVVGRQTAAGEARR